MFHPGLNVNVFNHVELFWHLLVDRSSPSLSVEEATKPPSTIVVPDKERKSLFALIIGINHYIQPADVLSGCVKDATDMRDYLMTELGVPESQIRFLTDNKAKRADIIRAFHEIQNDTRIQVDDPILIFFAGHGDETDAPTGWPSGNVDNQVQMIVPQDFSREPSSQVHGIPDHTLAVLLNGMASKHGDNITVIFDCCHSSSGTRADRKIRGIKGWSQPIPPDLDFDVWSNSNTPSGFRISSIAPGFTRKGLNNHVLLAACTQNEGAADGGSAGGAFTQALLRTLKVVGADKLTYASVLERLDKIPSQNPQCEGAHQHRIFFNSKAPPPLRVCFPLKMKGAVYEMQAGTVHGVTQGAEFSVYESDLAATTGSNPLGVLVASSAADIHPFTTTLKPKESTAIPIPLSESSCVSQIKAGEAEDLLFFAPLDEKLMLLYEVLATMMKDLQPGQRRIRPVLSREKAQLGLSIVDDKIAFDIFDPLLVGFGLTRMPHTIANNHPRGITRVLDGAAHFYWFLNRELKDVLVDTAIVVECHTLGPSDDYDEFGDQILMPAGNNLFQLGVIDVVASEDTVYGFKVTNKSTRDLYVNVFYFDNTDFSITQY